MTPAPHLRTATELRSALAAGEVSPQAVVADSLFQMQSTAKLNAIVQPLAEQAREQAQQPARGLLAGVPVTIKDCFELVGTSASLGFSSEAKVLATRNSPLVARLRAAGAIVIGKTNVPQAMMLHECANPVFGRTLHPQSPERSPGGSSGGEAVAVATGCSAIGLGTDLGGSIRQPAHACGIAGLKPTTGRLTLVGSHIAVRSLNGLGVQPGPLARSVDDLDLAMRVLTDTKVVPRQVDELAEPWPDFRRVDTSALRIAWWSEDGFFTAAPAVARATREAAAALAGSGCTTIEAQCPRISDAMRIFLGLVSGDGLKSIREHAGNDKLDPQVWRQLWLARVSGGWRRSLTSLLRLLQQPMLTRLVELSGPRPAAELAQLADEHLAYREAFWAELELATGGRVDAVLTPPHATVALRHGSGLDLMPAASYCFLPNLLDIPAGVVPWTNVRENEQRDPRRGWDLSFVRARKNARNSAGLPVGVQVFARMGRDDVVLAVLKRLEDSRGSDFGPRF